MRAREVLVVWVPAVFILSILSLSFLLVFLRQPIDEGFMLQVDTQSRVAGERWATVHPVTGNYWIGSWGRVFQVRDGDALYHITVNRYLNILPDVIHDAKPAGWKFVVHK